MITITRSFRFDAAHRLLGHESKCRYIHGHSYIAEVTVQAPELDSLGRVVDFSVMKETIGLWIDKNFDHNILLNAEDPLLAIWFSTTQSSIDIFARRAPYNMGFQNPTVENIVIELFISTHTLLPPELKITHIRLYETPNCFCDFYPEPSSSPTG